MNGYAHPAYAASLAEFGTPLELPRSRGWLLQRSIPGYPCKDVMGCYPLFACQRWAGIPRDLEDIQEEFVSVVLVTDPFGTYTIEDLKQAFPELHVPFKEHFVVDLRRNLTSFVSEHHRRNVRQAVRSISVEWTTQPLLWEAEWMQLYSTLIERHGIRGIAAFSSSSFRQQLQVPGILAFRALHRGDTVGMTLWYLQHDVAYYHLGAYNDVGYASRASFAVFWDALRYLSDAGARWACLGAGAGIHNDQSDGLTRFKAGWATGTRTAFLCGRIFDQEMYHSLICAEGIAPSPYFPLYRRGEFA